MSWRSLAVRTQRSGPNACRNTTGFCSTVQRRRPEPARLLPSDIPANGQRAWGPSGPVYVLRSVHLATVLGGETFGLVLGHPHFLFARYAMHQDLQTLLRCHMTAFGAIGGVPIEILYDRQKTAETGEDVEGHII